MVSEAERLHEGNRVHMVVARVKDELRRARSQASTRSGEILSVREFMWQDLPHFLYDFDQAVDIGQNVDILRREEASQRALKARINRLSRMVSSPYFARVDFIQDGESVPYRAYIGLSSLLDRDSGEYLVHDWRAPISSLFYDYPTGPASYDCDEGRISGVITLRRQYRISDGELQFMFDSDIAIDDEILQEILGKSADDRMRSIVTTIQMEQNRVIRDDEHRLLIVQGTAGSGKTSIALHRIAYMLYRHKDTLSSENIIIFSPNRLFNDYISGVLPELGEENVNQTTFHEYARSRFGILGQFESFADNMEYILTSTDDPDYGVRMESIRYKTSRAFYAVMKAYLRHLGSTGPDFRDLCFNGQTVITRDELYELFREKYSYLPVSKRLEKIRRRVVFLLDPHKDARARQLTLEIARDKNLSAISDEERLELVTSRLREETREIDSLLDQWTGVSSALLYSRLWADSELFSKLAEGALPDSFDEIRRLTTDQLSKGVITYEDSIPMLFLMGAVEGVPDTGAIRHCIIDEAQDYSLLQYEVINQLLHRSSKTILGDINQSVHPFIRTSPEEIEQIMETRPSLLVRLETSYRSTREITEFARCVLPGGGNVEAVSRRGAKPRVIMADSENRVLQEIVREIERQRSEGMNSIAIICKTSSEASLVYSKLKQSIAGLDLVGVDDQSFRTGTVVIPVYLSKGLEFDSVIVFRADGKEYSREMERSLLYTACTRALHALSLFCVGELSPFISEADPALYESTRLA